MAFLISAFIDTQDVSKFPITVPTLYPAGDGVGHRGVWIGLRTDEVVGGAWSDNSTIDYTNWIEGKPDNYKGQEGCAQIYVDSTPDGWAGNWDDISCQAAMPYICKRLVGFKSSYTPIQYQGEDYIWHPKPENFAIAEDICRQEDNAFLVSIATQAQLNFLVSAFVGGQPASDFAVQLPAKTYPSDYSVHGLWIGFSKTGFPNFTWVDANTTTFTSWAPSTPDDLNGISENCTHIYLDDLPDTWYGKWNDISCAAKMPFVCKRKATGKGIKWDAGDNSTANLPGVNIDTSLAPIAAEPVAKKKDNKNKFIIAGSVVGAVLLAFAACIAYRISVSLKKTGGRPESPKLSERTNVAVSADAAV